MPPELVQLFRVGVEVIVVLAGAIWVVSKIRGTTEMLRLEIHTLGDNIRELKRELERIENRQWEHQDRLTRLEAAHQLNHPARE